MWGRLCNTLSSNCAGYSYGCWWTVPRRLGWIKSEVKTAILAFVLAGLGSLIIGILSSSAFLLVVECLFIIE